MGEAVSHPPPPGVCLAVFFFAIYGLVEVEFCSRNQIIERGLK